MPACGTNCGVDATEGTAGTEATERCELLNWSERVRGMIWAGMESGLLLVRGDRIHSGGPCVPGSTLTTTAGDIVRVRRGTGAPGTEPGDRDRAALRKATGAARGS